MNDMTIFGAVYVQTAMTPTQQVLGSVAIPTGVSTRSGLRHGGRGSGRPIFLRRAPSSSPPTALAAGRERRTATTSAVCFASVKPV